MDAKEFLSRATVLNEKINMDFLHLQRLKRLLEQLGGSTALHEHVQGGQLPNSPATNLVEQIADLEQEIDAELAEYDVVMRQIKAAIAYCGNSIEMQILNGLYLGNKRWKDLETIIGLSKRRLQEIHRIGLDTVQNYLDNNLL